MGVNPMHDLTWAEYSQRLGYSSERSEKTRREGNVANLDHITEVPESMDWRAKGAVTPLKDQGSCGSCWAFSAVGSLEGHNFLCTGKLEEFAEQQLVDCSNEDGSAGCDGGEMTGSFKFWTEHKADFEAEYLYTAKTEICHPEIEAETASKVKISGYNLVEEDDFTGLSLKKSLTIKPNSIGVHAGQEAFRFYRSGVLTDCAPAPIDHGIVAIGYGTDEETGLEYFYVKNSWGNRWGDGGFGRIQINNECGITHDPSFIKETCDY
jgi:C1A family cysteine protease